MSSGYRWAGAAVVAIGVAALVTGCGGSGDEPAKADVDPAKASYIEEADATCARQSKKIQRLIAPYEDPSEMVHRALAPAMGFEIRSVRALVLPEKYVQEVLDFLEVWQRVVDQAEKDPTAFVRAENPFAEPERLARDFGFEVCGSL